MSRSLIQEVQSRTNAQLAENLASAAARRMLPVQDASQAGAEEGRCAGLEVRISRHGAAYPVLRSDNLASMFWQCGHALQAFISGI